MFRPGKAPGALRLFPQQVRGNRVPLTVPPRALFQERLKSSAAAGTGSGARGPPGMGAGNTVWL